jgi:hypothetical protein
LLRREEGRGRVVFRFERGEREMFAQVLAMFPIKKDPMRAISQDREAQALLEKTLGEQRAKAREEAERLLRTNGELVIDADFNEYWDLRLTEGEVEVLLQMLNNIRVGTWYELGCPEPTMDVKLEMPPDDQVVRGHVIMQFCAAWEGLLMSAVDEEEAEEQ